MLSKVSFMTALLLLFLFAAGADGATFVVTKTADTNDGVCNTDCSLREAMTAADANGIGADTIEFEIPGSGVKTINITSQLPEIDTNLTIDGTTQTGYFGMPLIEINGAGALNSRAMYIRTAGGGVTLQVKIQALVLNRHWYAVYSDCFNRCDITLLGNFIGTDPTGEIAVGNSGPGIQLTPRLNSVITIGGAGLFEGNVISGNGGTGDSNPGSGIYIAPPYSSSINTYDATINIRGNKIGTDFDGETILGNEDHGIHITERFGQTNGDAGNYTVTIGGNTAGARNVISGNDASGIDVECHSATIRGNYIGTNAAGTVALGNGQVDSFDGRSGISLGPMPGGNYIIGGANAGEGNVISGNLGSGIFVQTAGGGGGTAEEQVSIKGNFIGTNQNGTAAVGNGSNGIWINNQDNIIANVFIGGVSAAERNVISGNDGGIFIGSGVVTVRGNHIGTDAAGTGDLGNDFYGIIVSWYANATIGSGLLSSGNLISGNEGPGILVDSPLTQPAKIEKNLIGTNAGGTAAIPNAGDGISVKAPNVTIGSKVVAADGNVISGNQGNGISILGAGAGGLAENVNVWANKIGTNSNRSAAVPNGGAGIFINGAANNRIGDIGNPIGQNTISGNTGRGVSVTNSNSNRIDQNLVGTNHLGAALGNGDDGIAVLSGLHNMMRWNSIVGNGGLGIDLGPNGVTANDPLDADSGANNLQNFPVIERAHPNMVIGSFNSLPNYNFQIDFYRSSSCDPSGHGEGAFYIGTHGVVTNVVTGAVDFVAPDSGSLGEFITATATVFDNGANSTSEFSQCVQVTPNPVLAFSAGSASVNESATTKTIVVNRTGSTNGTISVNYATTNGTATAGEDYPATNGTLTFGPGEAVKTFDVTLLPDGLDEPNETVTLTLTNASTGVNLANSPFTLTIDDDDPTPVISITNVSANEGNSGTTSFTFDVTLSSPSASTVSVHFETEEGTSTPWADFTPTVGNLSFAPAELTKTITVPVIGDAAAEPDETFFLFLSTPQNATVGTGTGVGTIVNDDAAPPRTRFDYDGDGKADVSMYRPSNGQWWLNRSSQGVIAMTFGTTTDKIVPGDYTGDGKTDVAFFRPSTGQWFVLRSEDSSFYAFPFGAAGDIPTPADFDGDGKFDPAVFRPPTATWYVNKSSGGTLIVTFGATGDVPVADDYDRDGIADFAIFRPSNGQWWLNRSTAGVIVSTFGTSTDKPMHGDFTGDGKADIAFWRPSTGEWFVQRSEDSSYYSFPFGANADIASTADFDGDGRFDPAIFRPSTATWFINRSTQGILIQAFGANGDLPTTAAFIP